MYMQINEGKNKNVMLDYRNTLSLIVSCLLLYRLETGRYNESLFCNKWRKNKNLSHYRLLLYSKHKIPVSFKGFI